MVFDRIDSFVEENRWVLPVTVGVLVVLIGLTAALYPVQVQHESPEDATTVKIAGEHRAIPENGSFSFDSKWGHQQSEGYAFPILNTDFSGTITHIPSHSESSSMHVSYDAERNISRIDLPSVGVWYATPNGAFVNIEFESVEKARSMKKEVSKDYPNVTVLSPDDNPRRLIYVFPEYYESVHADGPREYAVNIAQSIKMFSSVKIVESDTGVEFALIGTMTSVDGTMSRTPSGKVQSLNLTYTMITKSATVPGGNRTPIWTTSDGTRMRAISVLFNPKTTVYYQFEVANQSEIPDELPEWVRTAQASTTK